jgi:hypothetical protein
MFLRTHIESRFCYPHVVIFLTKDRHHYHQRYVVLAQTHVTEGLRIFSKIYGANHPKTAPGKMILANISKELSEISKELSLLDLEVD